MNLYREVLGDVTPGGAGADDPAEGVEDVAEDMLTPSGVLVQQAEVGRTNSHPASEMSPGYG